MSERLEVGGGPLQAPNESVHQSVLAACLWSVIHHLGSVVSSPFLSLEFTYWATFSTQHLTMKLKIPLKMFFIYMPGAYKIFHKLYPQEIFSGHHSGPNHSYFRCNSNKCFLGLQQFKDGRKIDPSHKLPSTPGEPPHSLRAELASGARASSQTSSGRCLQLKILVPTYHRNGERLVGRRRATARSMSKSLLKKPAGLMQLSSWSFHPTHLCSPRTF